MMKNVLNAKWFLNHWRILMTKQIYMALILWKMMIRLQPNIFIFIIRLLWFTLGKKKYQYLPIWFFKYIKFILLLIIIYKYSCVFRRQDAVTFEGDLTNDEAILNWLTSQEVFSIGDEIEEVNRKMLEKLLEENDFVAVYFCKKNYIWWQIWNI